MYKYFLIDLRNPEPQAADLINRVYEIWKRIWNFELGLHGESAHVEEFSRSNILAVVIDEQSRNDYEVAAFHLYTGWNLTFPYHSEHPYFAQLPENVVADIRCNRVTTMTMEYLTVTENYRKSKTGLSFGEIIINLGLHVLDKSPWNSALGTSRVDRKVNRMGDRLGFATYETIKKYNYDCTINIVNRHEWKYPEDQNTAKIVKQLWADRIDLTQILNDNQQPNKAVA